MSEKISVLIPTYNRQDMIRDAIRSIQEQTHQNFEIVIVDDGSTDDTEKCVADLRRTDSRIIYRKVEHKGVAAARNITLDMATSKVACWQDSDDISSKYRLEKMLNFLNNSDSPCVGCSCEFFKGSLTSKVYKRLVHGELRQIEKRMGFASAMFIIELVPRFHEGLIIGGEDAQWLGQLRDKQPISTMSDIMYFVRYHADRISHQRRDPKNKKLVEACNKLRKSS